MSDNKYHSYSNVEFGLLDIFQIGAKFWFPASECALKLGYMNPRDAVKRHCTGHGVVKHDVIFPYKHSNGTESEIKRNINLIDEGNLYRLIVKSKLESAQRFESWVFDTVLPSIRKHGAYITPSVLEEIQKNTEKNAELLSELAKEQKSRTELEDQCSMLIATAKQNEPKVSYYDTILQNSSVMPITLIAKDYGYSARKFNKMLFDMGIQFRVGRTWALYQKYAGFGYTHNNVVFTIGDEAKIHMCWTQKGRKFLYDILKNHDILPKIEKKRRTRKRA